MGVEIEVLRPGDGETFGESGDTLEVHYVGTLTATGKQFDSSRDKGRPFRFTLGAKEVIRGWEEGMARISLGEKAVLRLSADFAYGEHGYADAIPPNSHLTFEVELLAIDRLATVQDSFLPAEYIAAGNGSQKKPGRSMKSKKKGKGKKKKR